MLVPKSLKSENFHVFLDDFQLLRCKDTYFFVSLRTKPQKNVFCTAFIYKIRAIVLRMKQYLDLIQRVLDEGVRKEDRTGTGTISIFGHQMRFDLSEGFPLVTTKKMFTRGIIEELLWFISGSTNKKVLQEKNVHIWDSWGDDETGELGPVYGKQWRDWEGNNGKHYDQLMMAVDAIKHNTDSRRIIVNSWHVEEIDRMGLPPCHCFFQFYVAGGKLSLQLYQRSADIFLGVPFNIASYALLLLMTAQVTGLQPGTFVHTFGDAHIYTNHLDQVRLQLTRTPYALPTMQLNPEIKDLRDFRITDFTLTNYQCHPAIKGAVSV